MSGQPRGRHHSSLGSLPVPDCRIESWRLPPLWGGPIGVLQTPAVLWLQCTPKPARVGDSPNPLPWNPGGSLQAVTWEPPLPPLLHLLAGAQAPQKTLANGLPPKPLLGTVTTQQPVVPGATRGVLAPTRKGFSPQTLLCQPHSGLVAMWRTRPSRPPTSPSR